MADSLRVTAKWYEDMWIATSEDIPGILCAGIDDYPLAVAGAYPRNLRDVRRRRVVQFSGSRKSMRRWARSSMRSQSADVQPGNRLNTMRPKSSSRPLHRDRPAVR